jgi:hypothetical protein
LIKRGYLTGQSKVSKGDLTAGCKVWDSQGSKDTAEEMAISGSSKRYGVDKNKKNAGPKGLGPLICGSKDQPLLIRNPAAKAEQSPHFRSPNPSFPNSTKGYGLKVILKPPLRRLSTMQKIRTGPICG